MAVEDELISSNPFKAHGLSVTQTAAEKTYVEKAVVNKVIQNCPDSEWKLLFAIVRRIPMRIPSEIREFTWADIDFSKKRMLIHSPKTRHLGKSARLVPIFDSLKTFLVEQKKNANSAYVFPRLRLNTNPGTTAKKIVESAEVKVWTNFFNSLRASAETDLMDDFGIRRACQWAGNSVTTAMKNYALVKKSDYEEAEPVKTKSDAKSDAISVGGSKNDAVNDGNDSQAVAKNAGKNKEVEKVRLKEEGKVGDEGLRP